METSVLPTEVRELPILGGHLALDFANTVDDPLGPRRWDHIARYPGLIVWCERIGMLDPSAAAALVRGAEADPARAADAARQAAVLRDALNETFGAVVDRRPTADGWAKLQPFLVDAVSHATVSPGAAPHWDFDELESVLWPVAEAAYRLLVDPELARLKRCAGCPWFFLDMSKNHSRRWCAMADCGTHEKIRRYVAKRANRPELGPSD
jgi:predicted RNA-binding Zn ribbon-like protein